MNKYLLLEAIRQSNMHPTTKSFLGSILKNVEEGEQSESGDSAEGGTTPPADGGTKPRRRGKLLPRMEENTPVFSEQVAELADQRAQREAKDLEDAAFEAKRIKELGLDIEPTKISTKPRGRVTTGLEDLFAKAKPAKAAPVPKTAAEVRAKLAQMEAATGSPSPKGAYERMLKEYGLLDL